MILHVFFCVWWTFIYLFIFNFFNVYFWDRERQSMSGGGAEREGDTESEAGSRLWAVSTEPNAGLELTDCEIMTWAEVGCSTDWATQAPLTSSFYNLSHKLNFWKIILGCWRGPQRPLLLLWSLYHTFWRLIMPLSLWMIVYSKVN